jgi:hypothetical protein
MLKKLKYIYDMNRVRRATKQPSKLINPSNLPSLSKNPRWHNLFVPLSSLTSSMFNRFVSAHTTKSASLRYSGNKSSTVSLSWTENNQNDALLNSVVEQAALSQLSIYPANQPIPQNPYLGPLPVIAGQPRPVDEPDNNNDDDDNSTLPDTIVYRIVDHFGDSDDDNDNRYE